MHFSPTDERECRLNLPDIRTEAGNWINIQEWNRVGRKEQLESRKGGERKKKQKKEGKGSGKLEMKAAGTQGLKRSDETPTHGASQHHSPTSSHQATHADNGLHIEGNDVAKCLGRFKTFSKKHTELPTTRSTHSCGSCDHEASSRTTNLCPRLDSWPVLPWLPPKKSLP